MSPVAGHPAWTAQCTVATPLGSMLLACTARGLGGAWFQDQRHHPGEIHAALRPGDPLLARAATQLGEYFAGRRRQFDLPLDLHGTEFQRSVWQALRTIDYGRLSRYAAVALDAGRASAVRAAGGAIGRNPVSVIVPCHRVVGHAGALTGYAGGIERKRALLVLEGAWTAQAPLPY